MDRIGGSRANRWSVSRARIQYGVETEGIVSSSAPGKLPVGLLELEGTEPIPP